MFKKKFRLPKGSFKGEKVLSSPGFLLKVAKNGESFNRFGIVVSKRIDKRASVRNRIKRKFRSYLEKEAKNIIKGYDLLFIIKKGIQEEDYKKPLFLKLKKNSLLE